jgi:hypothetical protein
MNEEIKTINRIQNTPYTLEWDGQGHAFSFRKRGNTWWLLAGGIISVADTTKLEVPWGYPKNMKVVTMPIENETLIDFLEFYKKYAAEKGHMDKPAINYKKILKELTE